MLYHNFPHVFTPGLYDFLSIEANPHWVSSRNMTGDPPPSSGMFLNPLMSSYVDQKSDSTCAQAQRGTLPPRSPMVRYCVADVKTHTFRCSLLTFCIPINCSALLFCQGGVACEAVCVLAESSVKS